MSDQANQNESGNTAVAEPPPPKATAKPAPKLDPTNKPQFKPPYAVVVLNDDDHTYLYVIDVLCRYCGHSAEKAYALAKQIDRIGRAAVWTGSFEVAELKRDQIKGRGPDVYAMKPVTYPLGVVLEPLPQ